MFTSSDVILVIEPDLIFDAAVDNEQLPLARRLNDYAELKLIAVVFVSPESPDQIAAKMKRLGFSTPAAIFNPTSSVINAWDGNQWVASAIDSTNEPDGFKDWIGKNAAARCSVRLCVSSSMSLLLTGELCSIVIPDIDESDAFKLYQQYQRSNSLDKLFLANETGLPGVFEGLHWFDSLPPGAVEYSRSPLQRLGAFPIHRDLARVSVKTWASSVDVVVNRNGWKRTVSMSRIDGRTFVADIEHFRSGDLYAFALDGNQDKLYPDPYSHRQPEGVHGFSELTGPNVFPWRDRNWKSVSKEDLIIYELHVGTFTNEGTFRSTMERLPELVELGVTAIELLPIVESAGRWNWGYDGVNLFAPYHVYGTPDELKLMIDQCHQLGLAVILDVVYNHPGPEGNYLASFGPYFSDKHHTPWGPAFNYDGRDRDLCREWVLNNVVYWLDEFHFDGLRLDAIHFMFDDSERSIVAEISDRVHQLALKQDRSYLLIGETNIHDALMVKPTKEGGAGFDAMWCDDMMHSIYSVGSPETRLTDRTYHQHRDVAESLKHGHLYQGPPTERLVRSNDTPVESQGISSLVVAMQTHDSVGNQPLGKRLHRLTNAEFHRAAAPLSLLFPAIPMLFMGDESLEPNPFHYFVDFHDPWLRDAIARSRRGEHPQQNWDESISPLSEAAFKESKLSAIDQSKSKDERLFTRQWYRQLISLRKQWVSEKLLHANQMTVEYSPQHQLFLLVYESGGVTGTVAVRLNNPAEAPQNQIAIQVEGKILADSSAASEMANTTFKLKANHAIIVEGSIHVLD